MLDSGALIALEKQDAGMRALLRLALRSDTTLLIPAPVLAQVWRDGSRQVAIARLVGSEETTIVAMDEAHAQATGILLGRSGTRDVVDAFVVLVARSHAAAVVTSDPDDLTRLDATLNVHTV